MTPTSKSFKDIHETELTKFDMRAAVLRGTSTVDARRKTACAELDTDDPSGYQAMRTRAASIKDAVLADLPSYLEEFANNAEAAGATIHFAADAADATAITPERAEMLVGLLEADAEKCAADLAWAYRVGSRDGENFALTADYSQQRVTVTITLGVVTAISVG